MWVGDPSFGGCRGRGIQASSGSSARLCLHFGWSWGLNPPRTPSCIPRSLHFPRQRLSESASRDLTLPGPPERQLGLQACISTTRPRPSGGENYTRPRGGLQKPGVGSAPVPLPQSPRGGVQGERETARVGSPGPRNTTGPWPTHLNGLRGPGRDWPGPSPET